VSESKGDDTKEALAGLAGLVVVLWAILFVPAGSLAYWQAWVYWIVFSLSVTAISAYFLTRDPILIQNRLKAGPTAEKGRKQNAIQGLLAVFFVLLFVVASLDHRFTWSHVPAYLSIAGDVFALLGLLIIFFVFKENSYTSGIIEVSEGQEVVSTGPYRIVRHPMYAGALLMLLFTPIALGSYWGLFAVVPLFLVIAIRLLDEERFLTVNLPGYGRYCQQTHYRLVPFVW
jgi:protein-S-isoprenylcysteine O-methyltransferase Ste14